MSNPFGIFVDGTTGEIVVRQLTDEEVEMNKPAEPDKEIPV
jgi:hypothetical protein